MIHYLSGDVLEVGAGDASRKVKTLRINKKINSYLATDHNSWDDEFERIDESVSKINGLNSIFWISETLTKLTGYAMPWNYHSK